MKFETLGVTADGPVTYVELAAPPMNLLGPAMLRDLVAMLRQLEQDPRVQVLVFRSADPDYFIPHVDITRVPEYRDIAMQLDGEPSLALVFRHLSTSRLVSIAQVEGRVRGAGSELVLACDLRFAAVETALFSQPEIGFGLVPGAGGMQHLTRLLGRGRALEALLTGGDYDATLAERYGWINRALPAAELGEFVRALATRIAGFPAAARALIKERVDAIALGPADDFRRDSELFVERSQAPETQRRVRASLERGLQTRAGELDLARMLGELPPG